MVKKIFHSSYNTAKHCVGYICAAEVINDAGDLKNDWHTRVFQATFLNQYPIFSVMPGGIPLSICRVCDLSNFMVCKCNFLQLKGLLEGWMEGKCCLPQARGWVRRAGERSMVAATIICGCSYDTEPDYAFWTNSIWSFVVGKNILQMKS